MSWLRSALSKAADRAAEVGSKNNLSRTVRSYAGAVYHQAAGGAKIVQDRLSGRNLNSFKDAVKRLNEVSLHARGNERLQALGRWLAALKEIDRETKRLTSKTGNGDSAPTSPKSPEGEDGVVSPRSPRRTYMALFYDFENGGEPMSFRDLFLQSRALEHIVTSMILEAPRDEEIGLLSEIFGLCLSGGQELHNAFISSLQDLAKAFSTLSEEIEIKHSDLLEMAQTAVSGLKLKTESERLDAEIFFLQQKMAEKQGVIVSKDNPNSDEDSRITEDVLEYGARVRTCLRRKEELLKEENIGKVGEEKVQKLKETVEGLTSSINEIEQRVSENRQQKDKAITYRDTKALEVLEAEKVLASEVQALQERKQKLEAELKEVNAALAAATARHINTQEEKEQFDEASSKIVAHLSLQEKELSKSIAARRAEATVAKTWLGFLEDASLLQSSCFEEKTKDIQRDVQEAKQQFLSIAAMNLSYHQEEMKLLLKHLKALGDGTEASRPDDSNVAAPDKHTSVMEKYQETEKEIIRVLEIIDRLASEVKFFELKPDGDDVEKKVLKSLETIDSLKTEFREVKRPELGQKDKSNPGAATEPQDPKIEKPAETQENEAEEGWELDPLDETVA